MGEASDKSISAIFTAKGLAALLFAWFLLACSGGDNVNGGGTSSGEVINKGPTAVILSSVQPTSGGSGDIVRLTGSNLLAKYISEIHFGATPALLVEEQADGHQLLVRVPAQPSGFSNPTSISIKDTTGVTSSLGYVFTYTQNADCGQANMSPVIDSINDTNILATQIMAVHGSNFDNATVNIEGASPLTLQTFSSTLLEANLPANPDNLCATFPCSKDVTVANGNGCSDTGSVLLQRQGLPVEKIFDGQGRINYGISIVPMEGDVNGDGSNDFAVLSLGHISMVSGNLNHVAYQDYNIWEEALANTGTNVTCGGQRYNTLDNIGNVDNAGANDLAMAGVYTTTTLNTWTHKICLLKGDGTGFDKITYAASAYWDNHVVVGVKDVNNDQKGELLVGKESGQYLGGAYVSVNGKIDVFSGANLFDTNSAQPVAVKTITMLESAPGFGAAMENLGDLNNDGLDEFAVGASGYYESASIGGGAIYIYSTADLDLTHPGTNVPYRRRLVNPDNIGTGIGSRFGYTISLVGDLDGDGKKDIIVTGMGKLWGFSTANLLNTNTNAVPLFSLTGMSDFWFTVSNAGDMNGDGKEDFIVGDKTYNQNTSNLPNIPAQAGRIIVYSGNFVPLVSPPQPLFARYGIYNLEYFGESIATMGDLNNDGVSDILIGGPRGNLLQGTVYLMSMYSPEAVYPPF